MSHGREPTWWSRNWGWVVGIGCGCLALPLLLVGACVGGLGWLVTTHVDTDTVFGEASALVEADPDVRERLGSPLEVGMFGSTRINLDDDEGQADYTRPVSGPDGEGDVRVRAVRTAGEWSLTEVVVTIDGETIDVLANAEDPGGEPLPEPDATGAPPSP